MTNGTADDIWSHKMPNSICIANWCHYGYAVLKYQLFISKLPSLSIQDMKSRVTGNTVTFRVSLPN